MKDIIFGIIAIVLLGYIVHLFTPWWSIVVVAGIVGLIFSKNAGFSFLYGFVGVLLLWGLTAFFLDAANESILSIRMGKIIGDLSSGGMIGVTALIGGLLGGLGAMTGTLGRKLLD